MQRLENARQKEQAADERAYRQRQKTQVSKRKKCDNLTLRRKWAEEDAANAPPKSAERARRSMRCSRSRTFVKRRSHDVVILTAGSEKESSLAESIPPYRGWRSGNIPAPDSCTACANNEVCRALHRCMQYRRANDINIARQSRAGLSAAAMPGCFLEPSS